VSEELHNKHSEIKETKKKEKKLGLALETMLLKKPAKVNSKQNFTEEERRERNRIAAANSRIKKKLRLKDLEAEVERLQTTIAQKDLKIASLENEVSALNAILYQERNDGKHNAKIDRSPRKRKRIGRSKQPMLSKSAKLTVLCCVSVCLVMSPLEGNSENYFAFAMGGMQYTNISAFAYIMGFLVIVACSMSMRRTSDTIFAPLTRLHTYYVRADVAKDYEYILPFYWISTAIRKDVSVCDEAIAASYVPKASLH